ncbi:precorrin-3B methylase [Metasolibacillus meyeri]|uniref:Precorrin-3B methylase n=1 Tax=Metasolibacillus meyeri TaxID=1071052 RepID=A0AAW9NN01_9BACL|nr:precorrin-3B methylase [Metasolibacillus meyeri]MEC1177119.1 precorrin-3B methylase [Metasolibacillus meyeri]
MNQVQKMFTTMPTKTFATLKEQGDYTCLSVAPGIVNKHFTAQQLLTIAQLAGETGAIKYSAAHRLLVSVETARVEEVTAAFQEVDLYIYPAGNVATFKWCDFCDGEKLHAKDLAEQLFTEVEGLATKYRLRIGFNACASACYNAVYDDIALVYYQEQVDIWVGAVPMGRHAKPGKLVAKKVPAQDITGLLIALLNFYNTNAKDNEEFYKFAKRQQFFQEWLEQYRGNAI